MKRYWFRCIHRQCSKGIRIEELYRLSNIMPLKDVKRNASQYFLRSYKLPRFLKSTNCERSNPIKLNKGQNRSTKKQFVRFRICFLFPKMFDHEERLFWFIILILLILKAFNFNTLDTCYCKQRLLQFKILK